MSAPLQGGTPVILAPANNPTGLALDANNVYWADNADGTLFAMPL